MREFIHPNQDHQADVPSFSSSIISYQWLVAVVGKPNNRKKSNVLSYLFLYVCMCIYRKMLFHLKQTIDNVQTTQQTFKQHVSIYWLKIALKQHNSETLKFSALWASSRNILMMMINQYFHLVSGLSLPHVCLMLYCQRGGVRRGG